MDIVGVLRRKSKMEACLLVGNVRTYIDNDGFCNLLNLFDVNKVDKVKDSRLNSQLNIYLGIDGMRKKISDWLSS